MDLNINGTAGDTNNAHPAFTPDYFKGLFDSGDAAAQFYGHVSSQAASSFGDNFYRVLLFGIYHRDVRKHFPGHFQTFGGYFQGKHLSGAECLGDADSKETDWPAAEDGHGFTVDFSGHDAVHGHTERFVDGAEFIGSTCRMFPAGIFRYAGVFGKGAVPVEAKKPQILAIEGRVILAIIAMPAVNVRFRGDNVTYFNTGYTASHFDDVTASLMPQSNRQCHHVQHARSRVVGMDVTTADSGTLYFN